MGRTTSVVNDRWISLQVSGISPSGVGWWAYSSARTTARNACASMARVTQRTHEVKRRSWCSSSPARPFPARTVSSRPGDAGRRGHRHRGRREATVVGEFTGGAVAADQQTVAAGPHFGQVDDGPVVGEHVADLTLFQRGPQLRGAAVDLVACDPAHAVPGVKELADHAGSQLRLGREGGLLAQPGGPAAVRVARPRARDVMFPVHRRVPAQSRIDEVDGDLRVFDPVGGAGVLALDHGAAAQLHRLCRSGDSPLQGRCRTITRVPCGFPVLAGLTPIPVRLRSYWYESGTAPGPCRLVGTQEAYPSHGNDRGTGWATPGVPEVAGQGSMSFYSRLRVSRSLSSSSRDGVVVMDSYGKSARVSVGSACVCRYGGLPR
jgi:hypothetical protein